MDILDVRILRLVSEGQSYSPLSSSFRESLAAMAKKVGADEETVRYRLKRVEDAGFIPDWRLYVNPRLGGGGQVSVWIDIDPATAKRSFAERLRLVPGVVFVTCLYDAAAIFVEYDHEEPVPRIVELIRQLTGGPVSFVARTAFPECRMELTSRDWDVIRALWKHPRKSYSALAKETGLSARTVRKRILRLAADGVVFAWPALNMRAPLGGVFVHLVAWYPGERKGEIDAAIGEHLEPYHWHTMHMLPYRAGDLWPCGYDLFVPNVSMTREILDWVRALPGVEKARAYLHEDIYNFFDTYDEKLDRWLRQKPTAMPASAARRTRRARAVRGSA